MGGTKETEVVAGEETFSSRGRLTRRAEGLWRGWRDGRGGGGAERKPDSPPGWRPGEEGQFVLFEAAGSCAEVSAHLAFTYTEFP